MTQQQDPAQNSPSHSPGAVDLTQVAQQAPAAPENGQAGSGGTGTGASWVAYNADQEALQQVLQLGTQVPVIIHLAAPSNPVSAQIDEVLIPEIDSRAGRMVMARVDVEAQPQLLQLFGGAQPPMVLAILGGQAMSLLNAPAPADQIKALLDELNAVAVQSGLAGTVPPVVQAQAEEPGELPPLHKQAEEALAQRDFTAATAAYDQALSEDPRDEAAASGKQRVALIERTQAFDANAVRANAAENPDDVQAQLDVADLDILGGHVDDAFTRLVKYISTHREDDRETARARLIDLYTLVGNSDPRVVSSRKKLAMALF